MVVVKLSQGNSRLNARIFCALAVCLFFAIGLRAGETQTVHGSVPPVIRQLKPLGSLEPSTELRLTIGLPLRHQDELAGLLKRLYDPASADYRHYLTPEQFTEKFGPTEEDYQSVIRFATTNGLKTDTIHKSRILLDVRGKVSDLEKTFQVKLRRYQHPTEAREFYAPDEEPLVDAGLPIQDITGLNDYAKLHSASHIMPAGTPGEAAATGSGPGGNYMGQDFRNAYAAGSALTGAGQMVGLFEASGYDTGDIAAYETLAQLPNVPLINVSIDGFNTNNPASGSGEASLDIEMAISMAPGLKALVVFEVPNNISDWLAALDSMASSNQIKQFSSSWGYTESVSNKSFDSVFQMMATEGQSFFQASGDGDAWVNPIWVPAASPYLTSVGGTSLTMTGSGAAFSSEKVWNSGNLGTNDEWLQGNGYWGSGGGPSTVYAIPSWQQTVNMTTNGGSTTMRNIPDVALTAVNIWVLYGNGNTASYMGTSCAAPLWAGFMALVNEQATLGGSTNIGFFNPTLYSLGESTNYSACFHDIVTGNNFWSGSPSNYTAVSGYDLCCGWGTPNGTNLINVLSPKPCCIAGPSNQTVYASCNAVFQVTPGGQGPITAQWQFNGTNLSGATNLTLSIASAQTTNAGNYDVVLTSSYGSITSSIATLTLEAGVPATTIYPPVLTERAGSHAAFSVSLAANGLSPTYQWYFISGGVTNTLAGRTASSLVLTNIQTSNAGTYLVVVGNIGATVTNSAVLNVATGNLPVAATNLVVARLGDGAQTLSGATGNTLFLDQYTTNGVYVNTVQVADESTGGTYGAGSSTSTYGSPALILPGTGVDAGCQGMLTTSYNQQDLCFAGYCLNYPFSGSDCTISDGNGGNIWRGLGEVNAFGVYTLAYTNTGLYSAGNHTIRSMASLDGVTNFWTTGQASGNGAKYANSTVTAYADGGGIPSDSTSTGSGPRVVQILSNGNLAYSDWDGSVRGIYWNTGTPEPASGGSYTSTLVINEGGQPGDFAFSPDNLTVYIGDSQPFGGSSAQAGGIERWDTTTPGTNYTFSYTLPLLPGGPTNGAQALTVIFPTNIGAWGPGVTGAVIYATSLGAATNSLVRMVDTGSGSTPTVLATAGANEVLRGVRFGLGVAPQIASGPSNQLVALGGNATFSVNATGTAPVSYQWFFGSTNLPGSTGSTLTIPNAAASNAGPYSVVVSNAFGVTTSPVATLGISNLVMYFPTNGGGIRWSNGQAVLSLSGLAGQGTIVLDASTNLSQWVPILTNPAAFGTIQLIDSNAAVFPQRFYRATVVQP